MIIWIVPAMYQSQQDKPVGLREGPSLAVIQSPCRRLGACAGSVQRGAMEKRRVTNTRIWSGSWRARRNATRCAGGATAGNAIARAAAPGAGRERAGSASGCAAAPPGSPGPGQGPSSLPPPAPQCPACPGNSFPSHQTWTLQGRMCRLHAACPAWLPRTTPTMRQSWDRDRDRDPHLPGAPEASPGDAVAHLGHELGADAGRQPCRAQLVRGCLRARACLFVHGRLGREHHRAPLRRRRWLRSRSVAHQQTVYMHA